MEAQKMGRRILFGVAWGILAGLRLQAQSAGTGATGPAMGFHLARLGGDPALGIELTSPYGAHGNLAVRGSLDLAERQGYPSTAPSEMTSEAYGVAKVGLVGVGGLLAGCIRLYGEGGLLAAFPKKSFSSRSSELGGYGHFGFEFLIGPPSRPRCSYFVELGTVGTRVRADRQVGRPFYLEGFSTGTGFRFYF